jgi:hypothetical protein
MREGKTSKSQISTVGLSFKSLDHIRLPAQVHLPEQIASAVAIQGIELRRALTPGLPPSHVQLADSGGTGKWTAPTARHLGPWFRLGNQ